MTRIYSSGLIKRPIAEVFDYVTTPGNWPNWHPSSLAVRGATGYSLNPGDKVIEDFRVAGRKGTVIWLVRERKAPYRWVIEGEIVGQGHGGVITYSLSEQENGTYFEREFVYAVPGLLFALLDRLFVRRAVQAESAEALRRLKNGLEAASQRQMV